MHVGCLVERENKRDNGGTRVFSLGLQFGAILESPQSPFWGKMWGEERT